MKHNEKQRRTKTQLLTQAFDVYQINKLPTNINQNKCIDIILTNAPNCYNTFNLPPLSTSDHNVVIATPNHHKYKQTRPKQIKLLARSAKIADTVAGIRQHDWNPIKLIQNTQEAYDYFYNNINRITDAHQPLKPIKTGMDKPWMNQTIKIKIKTRQQLYYKLIKSETKTNEIYKIIQNETETKEKYKQIQKEVAQLIKTAKFKYNRRFTNNNPDFWKVINEIKNNKQTHTIDQTEAEQINKAFYDVWNGQKQPDLTTFIYKTCPKPDTPIFTPAAVDGILKNLRTTSAGPDDLSPRLLKAARLEICDIISHLGNLSINTSTTPTQHKHSNITPIPKVPHPTNPLDYNQQPFSIRQNNTKSHREIHTRNH